MILHNQQAVPRLQIHRFVHDYLRNFCIEISCFFMFFRCRFRVMKNQWFWHPFWHHFGSLLAYFSCLFRHRFLPRFWKGLFPGFGPPLETLNRLFEKMAPKCTPKRSYAGRAFCSFSWGFCEGRLFWWFFMDSFAFTRILYGFLMIFAWFSTVFWMDFRWLFLLHARHFCLKASALTSSHRRSLYCRISCLRAVTSAAACHFPSPELKRTSETGLIHDAWHGLVN